MKVYFLLSLLLLSFSTFANVTGIFDIWEPEPGEDVYLILATNRQVYEVSASDEQLLRKLYQAKDQHALVTLHLVPSASLSNPESDQRETISDLTFESASFDLLEEELKDMALGDEQASLDPAAVLENSLEQAQISNLGSMDTANSYFRELTVSTRARSQCYNRAHVWSFDLWKKFGVNSLKVWLFFTRTYIKRYRYKWWFHVTPATRVNGYYDIITLDRKYMRGPTPIDKWKNFFVKSHNSCPFVNRYSDYRNNQYAHDCYYIVTSMYFWQPYQIEQLEQGKLPPNRWHQPQINIAYRDAIYTGRWWRRRRLVIPRVDG